MKKKIMLILTLAVLFTTVPAIALSPQVPEVIIRAVAGQTFEGRCTGYESVGGNFSIYVKLYERARYSVEDIKAVGETDYIDADIGSAMVYSVTANEDGYILNESDPNASPVYMIPDGNGYFYAQDAEGHFFMKEALEISCPIAADVQFIDASNPGEEPTILTGDELVEAVQDNRNQFGSVEITFNDKGEISRLQKNQSTEEAF